MLLRACMRMLRVGARSLALCACTAHLMKLLKILLVVVTVARASYTVEVRSGVCGALGLFEPPRPGPAVPRAWPGNHAGVVTAGDSTPNGGGLGAADHGPADAAGRPADRAGPELAQ